MRASRLFSCALATFVVLTLSARRGWGQDDNAGTILGRVTAAGSGGPLVGARVTIVGSTRGTSTDDDGRFRIGPLPAGDYTIEVSRGDRAVRRQTVRVAANRDVRADVVLAERSVLLPGVIVSATRDTTPADQVAATVHELPSSAVRTSTARTADDLVREMPGVELPRGSSSVLGPETIVSIRGVDEGRTLVLLDGVPVNDPWGEWVDWDRVSPFSVDRVELVEGGEASLYGNYAMGGVVQFFRRPITANTFQANVDGGSRSLYDVSLLGSQTFGAWGIEGSGTISSGGGYIVTAPNQRGPIDVPNTSVRRTLDLRTQHQLDTNKTITASANYLAENRREGTPLTPNNREIGSGSLGGDFGTPAQGQTTVRLFGTVERYDDRQSVTAPGRAFEVPAVFQHIPSYNLGGSASWSRAVGPFTMVGAGADFRYLSGDLDEQLYDSTGTPSATRTSHGTQEIGGVYVQSVITPTAPLRIETSLRLDGWHDGNGSRAVSDSGTALYAAKSDGAFSPRVGVSYTIAPSVTLRASGYEAFRAPALSEEYRQFLAGNLVFAPNPELGPEHLIGGDAGLDWRPVSHLELRFTAFYNHMRDLGAFAFLAPGYLQRQNVGTARAEGLEGEVGIDPLPGLHLSGSYDYDDARNTSGSASGTRVSRIPLQRADGRITYESPFWGDYGIVLQYEGQNTSLSGAPLTPFTVVNLHAGHSVRGDLGVFLNVENLLNRTYPIDNSGGLISIGMPFTIRLGLRIGE